MVSETHDGVGDSRVEAQGEVAVAVLALDSGDLSHAANHIGAALHSSPALPEAHESLARLAVAAGGAEAALEFYPTTEPYAGAMAARTHLLAAAGRWDAAVSLLAQLVAFDPNLPWAQVPWLGRPELAATLSADTVLEALLALNRALPEPVPESGRRTLAPLVELLCAAVDQRCEDIRLLAIGSGLARRLTAFERAESWAVQAHRREPSNLTSVMLGQVYRATGRADEAIAVWSDQLRRDPSEDYLAVDLAELYADTGRPELGLPWLETVLAADPAHEKAAPAWHGLQYRIDGDLRHLVALADHLRAHPDHHYADELLVRYSSAPAWLGHVPPATEALVNMLRQAIEYPDHREHRFTGAVSMIEPPSAMMTLRSVLRAAVIEVSEVGDPDPRIPGLEWDPAGAVVWRYPDDARTAVPAVPAPHPEAAEKIRQTVHLRWPHLPAAYDFSVTLADLALPDLIGVLVHPPEPRDDEFRDLLGRCPDLWVRAVQVFACLGIAHHRTDELWPESTRRAVLFNLLRGPEDWVCEAAAVALVAVAWTHPETRADIGFAICRRMVDLAQAQQSRPVTILESICGLVLACPWVHDRFLAYARDATAGEPE
ncbi:hypothetical protein H0264_29695 [Nocardia huaxiensis]|uniref:Uncharacterized protein n=1 Tax=Nocardia huaxiensis TaxID=2755382 RepID=A0A7D6ZMN7_9NOCA|nr:tetratricopeptide repeat protein [Nocardia huaxiensis]QLY29405.1 hypothetical protein H0264_29695 [Nocardia huaxiensis]